MSQIKWMKSWETKATFHHTRILTFYGQHNIYVWLKICEIPTYYDSFFWVIKACGAAFWKQRQIRIWSANATIIPAVSLLFFCSPFCFFINISQVNEWMHIIFICCYYYMYNAQKKWMMWHHKVTINQDHNTLGFFIMLNQ